MVVAGAVVLVASAGCGSPADSGAAAACALAVSASSSFADGDIVGLALNLQALSDAERDPGAAWIHQATVELFTTIAWDPNHNADNAMWDSLKESRPDVYELVKERAESGQSDAAIQVSGDPFGYAASADSRCRSNISDIVEFYSDSSGSPEMWEKQFVWPSESGGDNNQLVVDYVDRGGRMIDNSTGFSG